MNQRLKSMNQWSKINESMIEVNQQMIQIIETMIEINDLVRDSCVQHVCVRNALCPSAGCFYNEMSLS